MCRIFLSGSSRPAVLAPAVTSPDSSRRQSRATSPTESQAKAASRDARNGARDAAVVCVVIEISRRSKSPRAYAGGCAVAAMIWSSTDWSGNGGRSSVGNSRMRANAFSM